MATIIAQRVESGAQKLLSAFPIRRFTPRIIGEIPIKSTGLMANTTAELEWDTYDNPVAVINGVRISLAVIITFQNTVFVYQREGATNLHNEQNTNTNDKLDVIGAVGFGVSSLFYKIPAELVKKKVASVRFSDFVAVEETDGQSDKAVVKMPIVVIEVEDINGCEEHFVLCPQLNETTQTAKLQAAIRAIIENM